MSIVIGGEEFHPADLVSALDLIDAWKARDLQAAGRARALADSTEGLLATLTFIAATSPAEPAWSTHLRTQLLEARSAV